MLKWLFDIFSENAKKLIGGGIVALVVAVAVAVWSFAERSVKSFIVNTIVEESAKEDGSLSNTFRDVVKRSRQSEASAVSVGSFILTLSNRSFTLYVYFPEGYKGKFSYTLKGDIVPKKRYVVLASPTTKPIPLVLEEDSIILEKYFQPVTGQAAVIADVFERNKPGGKLQNNLRPITFQLEGTETDEDVSADSLNLASTTQKQPQGNAAAIEVSYVALITPALQMGQ